MVINRSNAFVTNRADIILELSTFSPNTTHWITGSLKGLPRLDRISVSLVIGPTFPKSRAPDQAGLWPAGTGPGGLVACKPRGRTAMPLAAVKANHVPACVSKSTGDRPRDAVMPLCSALAGGPHLQDRAQLWSSPAPGRHGRVGKGPAQGHRKG